MDRYGGCMFQRPFHGEVANDSGEYAVHSTASPLLEQKTAHHIGRLYVTTALVAVGAAIAVSPAYAEILYANEDQADQGAIAWNLSDQHWLDTDQNEVAFQNGDTAHLGGDGSPLKLELTEPVEARRVEIATSRFSILSNSGAKLSGHNGNALAFQFMGNNNTLEVDAELTGKIKLDHGSGATGGRLDYRGTATEVEEVALNGGATLAVSGHLALQGGERFEIRGSSKLEVTGHAEGDVRGLGNGATKLDVTNGGHLIGDVADIRDMRITDNGQLDGDVSGVRNVQVASGGKVTGRVDLGAGENLDLLGGEVGQINLDGQSTANLRGQAGGLDIGAGAKATVDADEDGLLVVTGLVTNAGQLTVDQGAKINNSTAVDNTGKLDVAGEIGSVDNQDEFVLTGKAGDVVNSGDFTLDGKAGHVTNSGQIQVTGAGEGKFAGMQNAGGQVDIAEGGRLTDSSGTGIENADGRLSIDGRLVSDIAGGRVDISGTGRVDGNITGGENITSSGRITGTLGVAGEAALNGGSVDRLEAETGATVDVRNTVEIGALGNDGDITIKDSARLTITGNDAKTGADGTLSVDSGATLAADRLDNDGILTVRGMVEGNVTSTAGSTVVLDGGQLTGNLDLAGDAELAGQIGGRFSGTGNAVGTGDLTLGQLQLSGHGALVMRDDQTLTLGAGSRLEDSARLEIGADGQLDGDLNLQGNDSLLVLGPEAEVTGNLINSGTIRLTGGASISGDLINRNLLELDAGSSRNELHISGVFRNPASGSSTIRTNGGDLVIYADEVVNKQLIDYDAGVIFAALQRNTAHWDIDGVERIHGDYGLINSGAGYLHLLDGGSLQMDGSKLENSAEIMVEDGGEIIEVGRLENSGKITVREGGQIAADRFVNEGNGALIDNAGRLEGTIVNRGDATLKSTGTIDGSVESAANADLAGVVGSVVNQAGGELTVRADNTLKIEDDLLVNESGGRVVLAGQLDSGLVQNESGGQFVTRENSRLNGRLENDGRAVLAGSAREVENRADMVVGRDGALVLDRALENKTSGQLEVEGKLSLADGTGPALVNEGKTTITTTGEVVGVENQGRLDLAGTVSDVLHNTDGGVVEVSSDLATVADMQNDAGADLRITGGNRLTVSGHLQNDGNLISRGRLSGNVTNTGDAALAGRIDGLYVNAGGETRIDGALNNSGEVRVNSGLLHVAEGQVLRQITQTGDPAEPLGHVNINADGQVQLDGRIRDGEVHNHGRITAGENAELLGTLVNAGTADLDGRVSVLQNVASGRVLVSDGAKLRLDDMLSDGQLVVRNGAQLDLRGPAESRGEMRVAGHVSGLLTNSGQLDLTGSMENLINEGHADLKGAEVGFVDNLGTIQLSGRSEIERVDNAGTVELTDSAQLTVTDRFDIQQDGRLLIDGGAKFDGRLVNHGVLESHGALDGVFRNTGRAKLAGSAAAVRNEGVMDIVGELSAEQMVNSDLLRIGVDSKLRSDEFVYTHDGGRTRVAGSVIADMLVREGGLLETVDTAVIDGKIVNEGIARLSGTVGDVSNRADGILRVVGDLTAGRVESFGQTIVMNDAVLTSDETLRNLGDGLLIVQEDGVVDTNVRSAGKIDLAGTITGTVVNSGHLNGRGGRIDKNLILQAGGTTTNNITVAGRVLINGGLQIGGGSAGNTSAILTETARIDLSDGPGRIEGDASLAVRGDLTLDNIVNDGGLAVDLSGRIQGNVISWGDFTLRGLVQGNVVYEGGTMHFDPSGEITQNLVLMRDYTLHAGQHINAAGIAVADTAELSLLSSVSGRLYNEGVVAFANGSKLEGGLHNAGGTIRPIDPPNGQHLFEVSGGMQNDGWIDMGNGMTGDVIAVEGGLSGTGYYRLDATMGTGESDLITVEGGPVTGELFFDVVRTADDQNHHKAGQSVTLLRRDGAFSSADQFTYGAGVLPDPTERVVYVLDRDDAAGEIQLHSRTNPAIGAISGNVALTQGLINTVINRPSSPYVTGLGFSDDKACRPGSWARALGGRADITGSTRDMDMPGGGVLSVESTLRANYHGFQVGTDFGCYDGRFSDWTIVGGAIVGFNPGKTTQPVHGVDPGTGQATGPVTSVNKADFDQTYAGVYASAMRGPLVADLQLRRERTDFTLNNISQVAGNDGLGLSNAKFRSRATTVSGSIAYTIGLGAEDSGWALTPTAGFGWTKGSTGTVTFDDASTLQIHDRNTKIVFAGASVSRAMPAADGNSALALFASGTFYRDFGSKTNSTFTLVNEDGSKTTQRLESDNLGNYGELSLGASYVRILDGSGPIKQLNASIRLDGRTGGALDSFGVTGQMRLQF